MKEDVVYQLILILPIVTHWVMPQELSFVAEELGWYHQFVSLSFTLFWTLFTWLIVNLSTMMFSYLFCNFSYPWRLTECFSLYVLFVMNPGRKFGSSCWRVDSWWDSFDLANGRGEKTWYYNLSLFIHYDYDVTYHVC